MSGPRLPVLKTGGCPVREREEIRDGRVFVGEGATRRPEAQAVAGAEARPLAVDVGGGGGAPAERAEGGEPQ
jgi:hypothetical protein